MAGNLPAIRAVQGTVSDLWKTVWIPTSVPNALQFIHDALELYPSPIFVKTNQSHMWCHQAISDTPTDSPTATMLRLWSSLSGPGPSCS